MFWVPLWDSNLWLPTNIQDLGEGVRCDLRLLLSLDGSPPTRLFLASPGGVRPRTPLTAEMRR